MNTPDPHSNPAWEHLTERARRDVPPPVNLPALLSAVQRAAAEMAPDRETAMPSTPWWVEFGDLLSSPRALRGCLVTAGAVAFLATWEVWQWWELLPWLQLLGGPMGGVL